MRHRTEEERIIDFAGFAFMIAALLLALILSPASREPHAQWSDAGYYSDPYYTAFDGGCCCSCNGVITHDVQPGN